MKYHQNPIQFYNLVYVTDEFKQQKLTGKIEYLKEILQKILTNKEMEIEQASKIIEKRVSKMTMMDELMLDRFIQSLLMQISLRKFNRFTDDEI